MSEAQTLPLIRDFINMLEDSLRESSVRS